MTTQETAGPSNGGIRADAQRMLPALTELRRALHRNPEVGLDLPASQALVLRALEGLGLEITLGRQLTSVVAVLRGARPGPVVLLRGDMDALPIAEDVDVDYRAENGAMHACGHDLHTAGLVGAARLLAARRDELSGSVVFMFQPGEEGYGGARLMLQEGLLDAAGARPVAAYAAHVGTGDRGLFTTMPGAIMASSSTLEVTLTGRGGHGSKPSQTRDPVPALAELTLALQSLMTRRVDLNDPAVLSVTRLEAGTALNVIPDTAYLGATLRAFSDDVVAMLDGQLRQLIGGIAAAHDLSAAIDLEHQYPVTVTDVALTAEMGELIRLEFGADRFRPMPAPFSGSEDFSFVLQEVPGCYIVLGARPAQLPEGSVYAHSARVQFDDSVLADQAAMLAMAAWRHVGPRAR